MLAEQRRSLMLEMVRTHRFVSLPELAEALDISESTVRRDLGEIERRGMAQRIHGGVLYTGESPKWAHFDLSQPVSWERKKAIAREAAKLIDDGDTVLLDGGSTTYEVARLLVGRPLHVVTNSLPVANLLAADPNSDLILIGGNVCPQTGVVRGPYADQMLRGVRVRKAILSTAAINDEGFFNNNLLLVETERAMIRAADTVIIVADSTKFSHSSLSHVGPLGAAHCLVVDSGITDVWKEKIQAAGIKLLVAGADL